MIIQKILNIKSTLLLKFNKIASPTIYLNTFFYFLKINKNPEQNQIISFIFVSRSNSAP